MTGDTALTQEGEAMKRKLGCGYCSSEPERGWLETDNNGPIVPCPICNPDGVDEYAALEE